MPYLVVRKDGKKIDVLGLGKLIFRSDNPRDGVSLIKDGEFTCADGLQSYSEEELVSFDAFSELVDMTDIPISNFYEVSEYFMLKISRRDGAVFSLIALSTGQY